MAFELAFIWQCCYLVNVFADVKRERFVLLNYVLLVVCDYRIMIYRRDAVYKEIRNLARAGLCCCARVLWQLRDVSTCRVRVIPVVGCRRWVVLVLYDGLPKRVG